jgi:hypothetical protein
MYMRRRRSLWLLFCDALIVAEGVLPVWCGDLESQCVRIMGTCFPHNAMHLIFRSIKFTSIHDI